MQSTQACQKGGAFEDGNVQIELIRLPRQSVRINAHQRSKTPHVRALQEIRVLRVKMMKLMSLRVDGQDLWETSMRECGGKVGG
jgi:hypothetical protein